MPHAPVAILIGHHQTTSCSNASERMECEFCQALLVEVFASNESDQAAKTDPIQVIGLDRSDDTDALMQEAHEIHRDDAAVDNHALLQRVPRPPTRITHRNVIRIYDLAESDGMKVLHDGAHRRRKPARRAPKEENVSTPLRVDGPTSELFPLVDALTEKVTAAANVDLLQEAIRPLAEVPTDSITAVALITMRLGPYS